VRLRRKLEQAQLRLVLLRVVLPRQLVGSVKGALREMLGISRRPLLARQISKLQLGARKGQQIVVDLAIGEPRGQKRSPEHSIATRIREAAERELRLLAQSEPQEIVSARDLLWLCIGPVEWRALPGIGQHAVDHFEIGERACRLPAKLRGRRTGQTMHQRIARALGRIGGIAERHQAIVEPERRPAISQVECIERGAIEHQRQKPVERRRVLHERECLLGDRGGIDIAAGMQKRARVTQPMAELPHRRREWQ
jgi:hypothetical protein